MSWFTNNVTPVPPGSIVLASTGPLPAGAITGIIVYSDIIIGVTSNTRCDFVKMASDGATILKRQSLITQGGSSSSFPPETVSFSFSETVDAGESLQVYGLVGNEASIFLV